MIFKVPFKSGSIAIVALFMALVSYGQEPMPGYYYANKKPKTQKGIGVEASPFTIPRGGLKESFLPTFFDVSLGYQFGFPIQNYNATFAPQVFFFISYAGFAPGADTLIYPIEKDGNLYDYGKLAMSNLVIARGGGQIIFWNNTEKSVQFGPGIGVSVGQYRFDYTISNNDSIQSGKSAQEFVMFSPCFAVKYNISEKVGVYLNLAYNYMAETGKQDKELVQVNGVFNKDASTFSPRLGFYFNLGK